MYGTHKSFIKRNIQDTNIKVFLFIVALFDMAHLKYIQIIRMDKFILY